MWNWSCKTQQMKIDYSTEDLEMDFCIGTNGNTCALALITLRAHFIAGRRQHCKLSNNVPLPNLLLCRKHLLTFLKIVSQICNARRNNSVYHTEINVDLKDIF